MRGFVGFVLVLVAVLALAALLLVPMVVRPIVAERVRAALPFMDQAVDVQVDLNPVGLLLGTIDSIHVTGAELETQGATIGALDLTITGVSTSSRSFASISGTLRRVALPFVQNTELVLDSVRLDGSSSDVRAIADLNLRSSLSLIGNAFADAGVPVESLELTEGGIRTNLFGQPVQVQVGVADGALELTDVAGGGPMTIVTPARDDPWRITAVQVTPSGMTIQAVIGTARLLPP